MKMNINIKRIELRNRDDFAVVFNEDKELKATCQIGWSLERATRVAYSMLKLPNLQAFTPVS